MGSERPCVDAALFLAAAPAMVRVRDALERAALAEVRVILYGSAGSGKRTAARFLHARSSRSSGPLEYLAARDGAALRRLNDPAYLSSLAGGIVVLEGVDESPPEAQSYLAAAIEELTADEEAETVRVMATATQDLLTLVESDRFRRDLYYLLDVFPVSIPPLRDRLEEIGLFMEHFHRKHANGRTVPPPPEGFLQEAVSHAWPGNLRELENLVAASVARTGGERWSLPPLLPRRGAQPHPPPFHQSKREFEAGYVRRLLLFTNGNVTRAAELAGKARKDFYALLARNGIQPSEFRR